MAREAQFDKFKGGGLHALMEIQIKSSRKFMSQMLIFVDFDGSPLRLICHGLLQLFQLLIASEPFCICMLTQTHSKKSMS